MNKENIISLISICLIIILFGAWYFIYSGMEHIGNSISTLVQEQASANLRAAQTRDISLSLDAAATDASKVSAHIIAPDGEVGFIEEVENAAKADGLDIQVDTVGLVQAKDLSAVGLEYLNLKISIEGSWSSTYQFLSMIETIPYDIAINQSDISLASDGVTKGPSKWQTDLQISVIKQQSPTE